MKKAIRTLFCISYITLLSITACTPENNDITFEALLQEITDRDIIAKFPVPYYECKQCSSYDRESVTQWEETWFANWDRSMFIRTENNDGRTEYVMMDEAGPGAIVRFWMTFSGENCGMGTLRIYLDNNKEPVIAGRALDIISGGSLVGEPLSTSVSDLTLYQNRGHNLYLPIPYGKHCKITYESDGIKDFGAKTGGECVYYNINYRTYGQGTDIKTFSLEDIEQNAALIQETQKQLSQRALNLPEECISEKIPNTSIAPGENWSYTIQASNAAIRKFRIRINAKNPEQALRNCMLSITFDNHNSINCPIGYFFGTGSKLSPSHTWYGKVDIEGSMTSYWLMPFKEVCTITLQNTDSQEVTITESKICHSSYPWDSNTMYFGVSWQEHKDMEAGYREQGAFDTNYVTLSGKGVYVGDVLAVYNNVHAWWGEGDEKIYVDGERFPSHFGTGTEDYYGYAWCRPEKISNHPFIAQPIGEGNFHPGYTINTRYRSIDAIPFSKSLKFDMEVWHWVKTTMDFSPTTFYYMLPE